MPLPLPTGSAAPGGYSPTGHRAADCHRRSRGRWPAPRPSPPPGRPASAAPPSRFGTGHRSAIRAPRAPRSVAADRTREWSALTPTVPPRRTPASADGDWARCPLAGSPDRRRPFQRPPRCPPQGQPRHSAPVVRSEHPRSHPPSADRGSPARSRCPRGRWGSTKPDPGRGRPSCVTAAS